MNNNLKKALIMGGIGFAVGAFICVIFCIVSYFSEPENFSIDGGTILYIFLGGLLGLVNMGTTVVYDFESWSIAKCTLVHFVVCITSFYMFSFYIDWFKFGDTMFFIVTAAFIVAYLIIWLVNYLSYKRTVKRLNKELKGFKSEIEE